jgi:magnesium chelatase family protein
MLARFFSCAIIGLDGVIVEVEVDSTSTLPFMIILGLHDTAFTCFAALPNSMVGLEEA